MAARAFFIRITGVKDDDIVSRLRIRWDSMTDMGNYERATAADEIERLRAEVADAYSKSADVLAKLSAHLCTASALEREKIIAERDEARRLLKAVVDMMRDNMTPDATHPKHVCDFIYCPEVATCMVCENWTDALVMCYPDDFQDEEDKPCQ